MDTNTTHPKLDLIYSKAAGFQNLAIFCQIGDVWETMVNTRDYWDTCIVFWKAKDQLCSQFSRLATIVGDALLVFKTSNEKLTIDAKLDERLAEFDRIVEEHSQFFGKSGESMEEIRQRLRTSGYN